MNQKFNPLSPDSASHPHFQASESNSILSSDNANVSHTRLWTPQQIISLQRVIGNQAVHQIKNKASAPQVQRVWNITDALLAYYPDFERMLRLVPGSNNLRQQLQYAGDDNNILVNYDLEQSGPGNAETIFSFQTQNGDVINLTTFVVNNTPGHTLNDLAQLLANAPRFMIEIKFYTDQIEEDNAQDAVTLIHELELHFVHYVELIRLARTRNIAQIRAKLLNDLYQVSDFAPEDPDIQHTDINRLNNYTQTMLGMINIVRNTAQQQEDAESAQPFLEKAAALQNDFIGDVFPKYARLNQQQLFFQLTGYSVQEIRRGLGAMD